MRKNRVKKLEEKAADKESIIYLILPEILADGKSPVVIRRQGKLDERMTSEEFEALNVKVDKEIVVGKNAKESNNKT